MSNDIEHRAFFGLEQPDENYIWVGIYDNVTQEWNFSKVYHGLFQKWEPGPSFNEIQTLQFVCEWPTKKEPCETAKKLKQFVEENESPLLENINARYPEICGECEKGQIHFEIGRASCRERV